MFFEIDPRKESRSRRVISHSSLRLDPKCLKLWNTTAYCIVKKTNALAYYDKQRITSTFYNNDCEPSLKFAKFCYDYIGVK